MEELFEKAKLSYLLGEQIYENLAENRPAETEILISPKHIGDTIFLCAFMTAYKRENNSKKVLMVVPAAQEEILRLFPAVDYILPLDVVDMEALQAYIWLNEYWNENGIRYAHAHGKLVLHASGVEYVEDYPYPSLLKNTLAYLELPEGLPPERIHFPVPAFSETLRERYQSAVLLMPGALSYATTSVPKSFWENLTAALQEKGIAVYVNYAGREGEIPVAGAEPLDVTFSELVDLSRYFRGFVGLRSGVCDLLAETEARLIAIYPEETPETGLEVSQQVLSMASLYDLGRTEGIWNLQYSATGERELTDRILRLLMVREWEKKHR